MNTTDKTLLGLACHARSKCSECPYEDMPECSSKLAADAEKMLKAMAEKEPPCTKCPYYLVHGNRQRRGVEV